MRNTKFAGIVMAFVSAAAVAAQTQPLKSLVVPDAHQDETAGVGAVGEHDITLPMEGGGDVIILNPRFIVRDQFNVNEPKLSFWVRNCSNAPWSTLTLQFEMAGFCGPEIRRWSDSITV